MKSGRLALVVTGMHRSGTSALAGVLARLGVRTPLTMMPPAPDNPRGFYESHKLARAHEGVLRDMGGGWSDLRSVRWDCFDSPFAVEHERRIAEIIDSEFADPETILVKDPRASLVFPIFNNALSSLGFESRVVIQLRHPDEVAQSLAVRNGFKAQWSHLLWLRYVLAAERFTRQVPRCFVTYTDLLRDWQRVSESIAGRLGPMWSPPSSSAVASVKEFLSASLKHHATAEDAARATEGVEGWAADIYHLLAEGTASDPSKLRQRCDVALAAYNTAVGLMDPKVGIIKAQSHRSSGETPSPRYEPKMHEQYLRGEGQRSGPIDVFGGCEPGVPQGVQGLPIRMEMQRLVADSLAHKVVNLDKEVWSFREEFRELADALQADRSSTSLSDGLAQTLRVKELEIQDQAASFGKEIYRLGQLLAEKDAQLASMESRIGRHEQAMIDLAEEHRVELDSLSREWEHTLSLRRSDSQSLREQLEAVERYAVRLERVVEHERKSSRTLRDVLFKRRAQQRLADADRHSLEDMMQMDSVSDEGVCGGNWREAWKALHVACLAELRLTVYRNFQDQVVLSLQPGGDEVRPRTRALTDIARSTALRWASLLGGSGVTNSSLLVSDWRSQMDREVKLLRDSELFNVGWYLHQAAGSILNETGAEEHYLSEGFLLGLDPSDKFSTIGYLLRNPDVLEAGMNPLLHFILYGHAERRSFAPWPSGIVRNDHGPH